MGAAVAGLRAPLQGMSLRLGPVLTARPGPDHGSARSGSVWTEGHVLKPEGVQMF